MPNEIGGGDDQPIISLAATTEQGKDMPTERTYLVRPDDSEHDRPESFSAIQNEIIRTAQVREASGSGGRLTPEDVLVDGDLDDKRRQLADKVAQAGAFAEVQEIFEQAIVENQGESLRIASYLRDHASAAETRARTLNPDYGSDSNVHDAVRLAVENAALGFEVYNMDRQIEALRSQMENMDPELRQNLQQQLDNYLTTRNDEARKYYAGSYWWPDLGQLSDRASKSGVDHVRSTGMFAGGTGGSGGGGGGGEGESPENAEISKMSFEALQRELMTRPKPTSDQAEQARRDARVQALRQERTTRLQELQNMNGGIFLDAREAVRGAVTGASTSQDAETALRTNVAQAQEELARREEPAYNQDRYRGLVGAAVQGIAYRLQWERLKTDPSSRTSDVSEAQWRTSRGYFWKGGIEPSDVGSRAQSGQQFDYDRMEQSFRRAFADQINDMKDAWEAMAQNMARQPDNEEELLAAERMLGADRIKDRQGYLLRQRWAGSPPPDLQNRELRPAFYEDLNFEEQERLGYSQEVWAVAYYKRSAGNLQGFANLGNAEKNDPGNPLRGLMEHEMAVLWEHPGMAEGGRAYLDLLRDPRNPDHMISAQRENKGTGRIETQNISILDAKSRREVDAFREKVEDRIYRDIEQEQRERIIAELRAGGKTDEEIDRMQDAINAAVHLEARAIEQDVFNTFYALGVFETEGRPQWVNGVRQEGTVIQSGLLVNSMVMWDMYPADELIARAQRGDPSWGAYGRWFNERWVAAGLNDKNQNKGKYNRIQLTEAYTEKDALRWFKIENGVLILPAVYPAETVPSVLHTTSVEKRPFVEYLRDPKVNGVDPHIPWENLSNFGLSYLLAAKQAAEFQNYSQGKRHLSVASGTRVDTEWQTSVINTAMSKIEEQHRTRLGLPENAPPVFDTLFRRRAIIAAASGVSINKQGLPIISNDPIVRRPLELSLEPLERRPRRDDEFFERGTLFQPWDKVSQKKKHFGL